MDKVKQVFCITKNIFLEEQTSRRVIMGYILGIALFGYWLNNFVRYVWDTGEPVNILEAFIVVEHHDKTILFLALGWLLIISDAPFIKRNTYLILCRSSRRGWNIAMWQYIMIQAFLYTACIATVSIIACIFSGFSGSIWSSPVYDLAMDKGNNLGVKYNMTFGWTNIMENMTVPQAFAVTFIFLFLYLAVLGNLLYVCSLLLKEIYGILIVFGIQISGYLLQQEGLGKFSFMAKAIPGYSYDENSGPWKTVCWFMGVVLILTVISSCLIGRIDFMDTAEE